MTTETPGRRDRNRRILRIVLSVILSIAFVLSLLALAYNHQRAKFINKANATFDPKEKAFTGMFFPWPLGSPTLFGGLDPDTARRIRTALNYESGPITNNGMTLLIYASDGTFFVRAN